MVTGSKKLDDKNKKTEDDSIWDGDDEKPTEEKSEETKKTEDESESEE